MGRNWGTSLKDQSFTCSAVVKGEMHKHSEMGTKTGEKKLVLFPVEMRGLATTVSFLSLHLSMLCKCLHTKCFREFKLKNILFLASEKMQVPALSPILKPDVLKYF